MQIFLHTIAKNACIPGETIHNLAGDVTETELYDAMIAADALGRKKQNSLREKKKAQ